MFRSGLAMLLAWLALPVAGADIYKWTDAQGNVHYGDKPVHGATVQPFKPMLDKNAEAHALELRRQAAEQDAHKRLQESKARESALSEEAKRAEAARIKADNCRRARANLERLQRPHMRLRKADATGQLHLLDETGRQTEIDRAQRTILENCAN